MKTVAFALLMAGMLMGMAAEADAAVCARGVYRAGCAGPRGAVVTTHPHARCHIDRYGRRICVR